MVARHLGSSSDRHVIYLTRKYNWGANAGKRHGCEFSDV